jgi:hypothetical protein
MLVLLKPVRLKICEFQPVWTEIILKFGQKLKK